MGDHSDLNVSSDDLGHLAAELSGMRDHLDKQVKRMSTIISTVSSAWQSDAGTGFCDLQQRVADDVVRLGNMLSVIEEAVRLSANGFTAQELETLQRLRDEQKKVDVAAEAEALMAPGGSATQSRILDL
jgi:WXG100 family type VII secretion target